LEHGEACETNRQAATSLGQISHVGKKRADVDLERGNVERGTPRQAIVNQHGSRIIRPPHLDRLGLTVDDPLLRHAVRLEEATLRDAIVPRRLNGA